MAAHDSYICPKCNGCVRMMDEPRDQDDIAEEYHNFSWTCNGCGEIFGHWSQHIHEWPHFDEAPELNFPPWEELQGPAACDKEQAGADFMNYSLAQRHVSDIVYRPEPDGTPVRLALAATPESDAIYRKARELWEERNKSAMDLIGIKERLAISTHYLRYFIFGGFIAFLSQIPNLLRSSLTLADIAVVGASITFLSIAMDLRNYLKYRRLTGEGGFPITTLLLLIFYVACFIWFLELPRSHYNTTRYDNLSTIDSSTRK